MNQIHASEVLTACRGKCIAVVGDLMLDRYVSGTASRISQEAPVPVVAVDDTHDVPGGAANVARNLLALGGKATVFGLVGADPAGGCLRALLTEMGAHLDGVVDSVYRKTTEKNRVMANRQQVVRIDTEDTHPASPDEEAEIVGALTSVIKSGTIDAVIVEDYAKGLITPTLLAKVIQCANALEIPVALDPHPAHIMNATRITAMTPNRSEAFQLAGAFEQKPTHDPLQDDALAEVAATLIEDWGVHYLLITLGSQGMILFREGIAPWHIATKAQEVFDVSGAGDTVIATLTLALASGASIEDAAEIANHAAGIVVGKMGTAVVDREEILASFTNHT